MSWSSPDPDTTCRGCGFVITAVKLRGCQHLIKKASARWCLEVRRASHIGQFGLHAQLCPHGIDRFGGREDQVDSPARLQRSVPVCDRITFRFGVPDRVNLKQQSITRPDVVFTEVECRSPTVPLQFAPIRLRQHSSMPTLTTKCGSGSREHDPMMNHLPCGSLVPIGCEFRSCSWGQQRSRCVSAVSVL